MTTLFFSLIAGPTLVALVVYFMRRAERARADALVERYLAATAVERE